MANTHLAIDKFSGADPDQDAQSFNQLTGRKIILALGDASEDAGVLPSERTLFSSLLRGPAAEWFENNITDATTWDNVRTNFTTGLSDG